jgi:hypothetical protein
MQARTHLSAPATAIDSVSPLARTRPRRTAARATAQRSAGRRPTRDFSPRGRGGPRVVPRTSSQRAPSPDARPATRGRSKRIRASSGLRPVHAPPRARGRTTEASSRMAPSGRDGHRAAAVAASLALAAPARGPSGSVAFPVSAFFDRFILWMGTGGPCAMRLSRCADRAGLPHRAAAGSSSSSSIGSSGLGASAPAFLFVPFRARAWSSLSACGVERSESFADRLSE